MDLATKLFSFSLGVQPNKATLKDISNALNGAVLSLAEKQKLLEQYAETANPQVYATQESSSQPQQPSSKPKPQVVWQISEAKMKELQWKRAQLIQLERAKALRAEKTKPKLPPAKTTQAKNSAPKLAPAKRLNNPAHQKTPQSTPGQAKTTQSKPPKAQGSKPPGTNQVKSEQSKANQNKKSSTVPQQTSKPPQKPA